MEMNMNQEQLNSMMKTPEEAVLLRTKSTIKNNKCPSCGYKYLGDGVALCVECENNKKAR